MRLGPSTNTGFIVHSDQVGLGPSECQKSHAARSASVLDRSYPRVESSFDQSFSVKRPCASTSSGVYPE